MATLWNRLLSGSIPVHDKFTLFKTRVNCYYSHIYSLRTPTFREQTTSVTLYLERLLGFLYGKGTKQIRTFMRVEVSELGGVVRKQTLHWGFYTIIEPKPFGYPLK